MSNLVTQVQNFFSEAFVEKTCQVLEERQEVVQKVIKVGIPCVLKGIINKAQKDDGHSIFNMARQTANMDVLTNNHSITHLLDAKEPLVQGHNDWLSLIFGDKKEELTHAVADYSRSKTESSTSILNTIIPVCLSFIGKHSGQNHLGAAGLFSWLKEQLGTVNSLVPQDVRFSNILNGKGQGYDNMNEYDDKDKPTSNFLLWLIVGILFVALCWYLMRSCNHDSAPVTTESHVIVDTVKREKAPVRESLKVKLINGVEIDAYKGGIEDTLVKCLNNSLCEASKGVWYDFDYLNFKVGSDSLTSESMQQVKNIVEILKAYPKAKIKIGGNADRTGDSAASWKISGKRAETVFNQIRLQGGNENQLVGKEGYGWQFAKYPADAPENDRKKDRRISLQLREK
jgi:outer membrane protein OmpA-like peptidoglycan-associated protein